MKVDALLDRLDGVSPRGTGKWSARCPAHADRSPSLSIMEGEKAVLLKCWAGCSLEAITCTLGCSITDLFYDSLPDPHERQRLLKCRTQALAAQQAAFGARGRRFDALREAETLIHSACGISIERWSDDFLNTAMDRLGAGYQLLESEEL